MTPQTRWGLRRPVRPTCSFHGELGDMRTILVGINTLTLAKLSRKSY